ncbi:hypothetical protein [Gemmatimonas sp.]|uniref:hypothetical protein n=1 Tax=Gemmatimonas sp. TaxID=1962908 RepID=UPI003566B4B8
MQEVRKFSENSHWPSRLLSSPPHRNRSKRKQFSPVRASGLAFTFCASWTGTYIDDNAFDLFVSNTSRAKANNTNSAFPQIGIGKLALIDPTSMDAVTGWQFDSSINGFSGLVPNQIGTITQFQRRAEHQHV